ncbi:protease [Xylanibacillus composti]|uniref:Membrane protein NfeD2 N-terminal transmembrane domain-containing protein n=1 Tax=Xylanibacillus composti TaxID=1572762 RepID=A0A8J4H447_9BACL|nr:protease [Xylanibacillus composti]MDT9725863.1 protease [Xylanibacillus composti]GIQ69181.1 hypothetical protein XYCOK13_20050 [Xylanibacillus composti]
MLELYWGCLIFGVLFVLVSVVLGDLIGSWFDGALEFLSLDAPDFIHPMTIVGGLTVFGGAGVLLTQYAPLAVWQTAVVSLTAAVLSSTVVFWAYVRSMKQAENSLAYTMSELEGKIGEVNIPIPAGGFGEVKVQLGTSTVYEIASGFDGTEHATGSKVIVVEVRDGVLLVADFAQSMQLE